MSSSAPVHAPSLLAATGPLEVPPTTLDFQKHALSVNILLEEMKRELVDLREEVRVLRNAVSHTESRLAMVAADSKALSDDVKRGGISPAGAAVAAGLPPPSPASLLPRQMRKDIVAFVKTHYEAIRLRKESAKETGEKFSRLYDILFEELCNEKMLPIQPDLKTTARAALIEAVNNRQTMERRKRRNTMDAVNPETDERNEQGEVLGRPTHRPRLG